jgi:pectate lyase
MPAILRPTIGAVLTVAVLSHAPLGPPVASGSPIITNTLLTPRGIVLSGTGGSNKATYLLRASPNLSMPTTNWPAVATNNFDADGTFNVTNPLPPGVAGQFYRLQIAAPAAPDFSLLGFAALSGFASNGTLQVGGTTGGAAGPLVVASNLTWLVNYLEKSNMPLRILVTSNIDLSPLANHHFGFPAGYPTGEILVHSNKTVYSTNGATISRGTLRIGKASNGKNNIIIRNLKFRDLWVFDPSGNYDTYGWDYIGLEGGSHHVWVDHCDFEQVYDGMIDVTHGSDYVTVSWNVFRTQKKCSLVGHSDSASAQAEDTGHLNVTFHHNYYVNVDERMPRMRFGNAHVFNLYCENLGGNGIQSTANAATLVENAYFYYPQSGSLPTREENGGPIGIVKVVNSVIVNLPGVNVQFRQFGQTNFVFNAPFAGPNVPYSYTNILDSVENVPSVVTNWAGVGKISF